MLARFHSVAASAEQLAHEFALAQQLFTSRELLLAARKLGLKAKSVNTTIARLDRTPLPAIAANGDGTFFIIAKLDQGKALIQDPRAERPEVISFEDLAARWSQACRVKPRGSTSPGSFRPSSNTASCSAKCCWCPLPCNCLRWSRRCFSRW
jgi:subfamily B ATP-binding cassette protein HlyB/CyaB